MLPWLSDSDIGNYHVRFSLQPLRPQLPLDKEADTRFCVALLVWTRTSHEADANQNVPRVGHELRVGPPFILPSSRSCPSRSPFR